ncbi:hypothetical protein GCM10011320_15630 [Neoroseomonas lacus]|uniref:Uncharacterized protein n=1 Tax=Neoroseomonas lacus TaxID=287609 RepID=A0A917KF28_9PROT|nr:hypothetical protein GCM10011320_15630 [Neoroseomonas lacus]
MGPPDVLVQDALTAAAAEGPMVPEAILATLLLKAAKPGSAAAAAAAARIGPPGAAERMLDRWIDGCNSDITIADPQGSARLGEPPTGSAPADRRLAPRRRRSLPQRLYRWCDDRPTGTAGPVRRPANRRGHGGDGNQGAGAEAAGAGGPATRWRTDP